uniref:Uncharacterized protein n=1 Tax=Anguilla anguilla TaxID=7936 RepID=A0A0E9S1U0_ANGAN
MPACAGFQLRIICLNVEKYLFVRNHCTFGEGLKDHRVCAFGVMVSNEQVCVEVEGRCSALYSKSLKCVHRVFPSGPGRL